MIIFLKLLYKLLILSLSFIGIYAVLAFLLPFIQINSKKTKSDQQIRIYILTNGVHTDIVCPIKSSVIDWSDFVSINNVKKTDLNYQYVAFGWGDKGFYLNTPTWADLTFSTAFKAAFWLSESAMHTTFYTDVKLDENCVQVDVNLDDYQTMVELIQNQFKKDANKKPLLIHTESVYGNNDAFYEAHGTYSLFFTCNTWANSILKKSNQKAALWTATDKGIFKQYKNN
ncbi:MAG: TIGR02117 family protein [Bacteroidota bacterium]|nr:TIGR02117 family protein [Bacteroidota bacterium]